MTDDPTIVETDSNGASQRRWQPRRGKEATDLLRRVKSIRSGDVIVDTAAGVLARGINPNDSSSERQETGLVVGYVQSGKTMSFETVAALACDNQFQMIIVIAGTSTPLLEQSTDRVRRDLGLDDPGRSRRWLHFQNPANDDSTRGRLRNVLADWRDVSTPAGFRKTILITVLKHHRRLQALGDLLCTLEMRGVPSLVIDDEADQASLNAAVTRSRESTTYRRLMEVRDALPLHTFLQYTATPQAPLLISIIDSLSPSFVTVLEPGEDYVGGREFFGPASHYIRLIPDDDVPVGSVPRIDPPESLLDAMRVFMMGVTAGFIASDDSGNRSMLVHPSFRTCQHERYYTWVNDILGEWQRILGLPDFEADKQALLDDFMTAHQELQYTVGSSLPEFSELAPFLSVALRNTGILEVNARTGGKTPEVDWSSTYAWVLVGGQAMNRGFTVEGLTVTYMPRGVGVGNADTVQQRGRFFGYKRPYLGFCRIYLEQATIDAFRNYIDHEEDMREQLQEHDQSGKPLTDWKRSFMLDPALSPCRRQVLEYGYIRGGTSANWTSPRVVLASPSVMRSNRKIVDSFIQTLSFTPDVGHPERRPVQRHEICSDIPLRQVFEELLVGIRVTSARDSERNIGMLLLLKRALAECPDELCIVYRISPSARRTREINEEGKVSELFQGEYPVELPNRGKVYRGDRYLRHHDKVTVQIHMLDLRMNGRSHTRGVPVIAVWTPGRLARGWIIQHQPSQHGQE